MKTIIEKTVRLKESPYPTIFNTTMKDMPGYVSIVKYAGKRVFADYYYTEGDVKKHKYTRLEIPKTLTTDEQVRDYVLAEISK